MTKKWLLALMPLAWGTVVVGTAASRATLRSPEPTTMLHDRHGEYLGEVNVGDDERLGFWPAEEQACQELPEHDAVRRMAAPDAAACLPERIVLATIAVEDGRFFSHPGVDPVAVGRAIQQNVSSVERISGASTLAMQVARMQDPGPRTYWRKSVEAVTAVMLVARYGRSAVLSQYLKLAPYGNNVHGVRYAARRYFRKPMTDLSWAETALLVGLPQSPGRMNPYTTDGRRRASARAQRVLDLLHAEGVLTEVDHARAVDELAELQFPERPVRPGSSMHFVLSLDGVEATEPEVRTTLDLELQQDVQAVLRQWVGGWRERGAGQAAAVVLDRETLAVRASVGSTGFDNAIGGAIDFTRTRRYPGSSLKPLLYAAALDRGVLSSAQVLDDLSRTEGGLTNADHRFLGPLLPRQALANSRNVPAVELAAAYGLEDLHGFWSELGLHEGDVPAEHYGLGIAIGGMPVRLIDLASAYGALANDGRLRPVRTLESEPLVDGKQIFSAEHARLVSLWLSDDSARMPTFRRGGSLEYPFAVAVKTGTSPDYRDSVAVAYSSDYIVAAWVGHPDWTPMAGISGAGGSGRLVQEVLLSLHSEQSHGLHAGAFLPPEGWSQADVCAVSGHAATSLCPARSEWFPPNGQPIGECTAHQQEHGRVVLDLPARYASWMHRTGKEPASRAVVAAEEPVELAVMAPADGARLIVDPDMPAQHGTVRLSVAVDPPVAQVVWYVDGEPFAVVGHPYDVRWPVTVGEHSFEARLPWRPERSNVVTVSAL